MEPFTAYSSSEFCGENHTAQHQKRVDIELTPSGTAIRRLQPPTLDHDGFMLGHMACVLDPAFQEMQLAEYAQFRPGRNTVNQLARRTAWGAYIHDTFTWHDRETYSLDAAANPEENGATRIFDRAGADFLAHPVTEAILRAVFEAWRFQVGSSEQLYQVQLSLIRYEPTIRAPAMPSPVAPHQDRVDGAIVALHRTPNLVGGLSRIYDLEGEPLAQMEMKAGDILFVRAAEVLHQVTPLMLEPGIDWAPCQRAFRDVLLVRFQAVGR